MSPWLTRSDAAPRRLGLPGRRRRAVTATAVVAALAVGLISPATAAHAIEESPSLCPPPAPSEAPRPDPTGAMASTPPPDGFVGIEYSHQFEDSEPTGQRTSWHITRGALPAGLTLGTETGLLKGVPTTAQTAEFTVSSLAGTSASVTIVIHAGPVITSRVPGDGYRGLAYEHSFVHLGSGAPVWQLESGSLPDGLQLDKSTGVLSGTPSKTGESAFTVSVRDDAGTAKQSYTLTIRAKRLEITSAAPPTGRARVAYSHELTVAPTGTESTDPVRWKIIDGALPLGLTLANGRISGVPKKMVELQVVLQALTTDGSAEVAYTLTIDEGPSVLLTYPNAMEFRGYVNRDVLWVGIDNAKKQLVGVADQDHAAYPQRPDDEYLSLELHDATGAVVKQASVTGGENAFELAAALRWTFDDMWTLKVTHREAATRLSVYTDGVVQEPDASIIQRFRIEGGHFERIDVVELDPQNPPDAPVRELYCHQFTTDHGANGRWRVSSGRLPRGLMLGVQTGFLRGVPVRVAESKFTLEFSGSDGTGHRSFTIKVTPGAPVQETYPNAVEFKGYVDREILWIGIDKDNQRLIGVADQDKEAHPNFPGQEYIAAELHDADDQLVAGPLTVNGDENAFTKAETLQWAYHEGWTLVVRHQEAEKRLSVFSDGAPLPANKAKSQRFRIVNGHFAPQEPVTITSPRSGTQTVVLPTIEGKASPGQKVDIAFSSGDPAASTAIGSVVAAADGSWKLAVPADTPLPVGQTTITAAMEGWPDSLKGSVTVTVVEGPIARLTIVAHAMLVHRLPDIHNDYP